MEELIALNGECVSSEQLQMPRAKAFAYYINNPDNSAFDLRECRQISGAEGVVICVHPEVPQRPKHDIQYEELLLVLFDEDERLLPEVLALRRTFPDVPHLNLRKQALPKSLCLFAERPEDLQLRWTPALLGERILWWMKETARGSLHRQDQPLEPFISGEIRPLIVPPDLFSNGPEDILSVYSADAGLGRTVLIADRSDRLPLAIAGSKVTLLAYEVPPQEHGIIRLEPQTLDQLHSLCLDAGFDLLQSLRRTLYTRIGQIDETSASTIILLAIPKVRAVQEAPEVIELRGFRCAVPNGAGIAQDVGPGQLGEALGVLARSAKQYLPLIFNGEEGDRSAASGIAVQMLVPLRALTPDVAAHFSGHMKRDEKKFLAIGQGAIGSQIFANLAKQGYGQWTLIDDDFLLPHNFTRHAVMGRRTGMPKALEMAARANEIFSGPPIAQGIVANLLTPNSQENEIAQVCQEAEIILDMSASVAVSRHLSLDTKSPAMRMSAFLSPSGQDLVLLSEGKQRALPLDAIEVQYLRAVLNDARLAGHLVIEDNQIRYGGTCRDLSSRVSSESVALHASLGATGIRQAADIPEPLLSVWRYDPHQISITRIDVALCPVILLEAEDWVVVADTGFNDKLARYRQEKLPRETCGVLLGYFDTLHKRIYLVDALSAPPDSLETADGCERGIQGLPEAVTAASERTVGQVEYVGEWHTHPDKTSCLPSPRDVLQMDWVQAKMHPQGKPALIMISCENKSLTTFVTMPNS